MPCVFCIAVFAVVGAAIGARAADGLETKLGSVATGPPTRTVDSSSVTTIEAEVEVPAVKGERSGVDTVPVAVSLHHRHERVRIQIKSHDLTAAEVEAVQDRIAKACGLDIVSRELKVDPLVEAALHGQDAVPASGQRQRTRRPGRSS